MSRSLTLVLLVAGSTNVARAQPEAPPPSPENPPPMAALADMLASAAPSWSFQATAEGGTFQRGNRFVTIAIIPACTYIVSPAPRELEVFRESAQEPGRYCLQLETNALFVDLHLPPTYAVVDPDALALMTAIGDRLRPPVAIPALGVSLRPFLFIAPTDDGFVTRGPASSRFVVSRQRLSCALLQRELVYQTVAAPEYVPLPPLRLVQGRAELCLERPNDALVVTIVDPVFAPRITLPYDTLDRELARVVQSIESSVKRAGVPMIFNGDTPVVLPRAGFKLRADQPRGNGWFMSASVATYKVVDGSAWEEPGADVLVPMIAEPFAIVVRREACTGRATSSPYLPREIASIDPAGTRYAARACIGGEITASVLPLGIAGTLTDRFLVRGVITAIARSRGLEISGRELHFDFYGIVSVPTYSASSDTRAGFGIRGGLSLMIGRPLGFLVLGGIGFGLAGENYRPNSGSSSDDSNPDPIGEAYAGGGGALTLGPVSVGLAVTANLDGYWPGTRDYVRGVGLLALQLGARSRVEVRTGIGLVRQTATHELTLSLGAFVATMRTTDLLDTDGERGLEFGLGATIPMGE